MRAADAFAKKGKRMKKITGIIGYPLSHTLSPVMHNAVYKKYGMDWEYRVFETKPEDIGDFFRRMRSEKIRGINVTIPHKHAVIPFLDSVDRAAKAIGAVNTVVNRDGRLCGYNTDWLGFTESLKKARLSAGDKRVVLLGAGGAAHAVAYSLKLMRPKSMHILNIDIPMTERLIGKIGLKSAFYSDIKPSAEKDRIIASADMVINTTSVGQHDENVPYKLKKLKKGAVVYDIIYNPARTAFLKLAAKKGARVINGLDMLIFQGMHSFRIWTGKKSDYSAVRAALKEKGY